MSGMRELLGIHPKWDVLALVSSAWRLGRSRHWRMKVLGTHWLPEAFEQGNNERPDAAIGGVTALGQVREHRRNRRSKSALGVAVAQRVGMAGRRCSPYAGQSHPNVPATSEA
jgi:hypothetical protein